MNDSISHQNIYIDTSALKGMSFTKDVASLLFLSKSGRIRLYMSETTLWERGRQQYESEYNNDRLVPFPDGFNRYLTFFKILFEKYGVIIIPSDDSIIDRLELDIKSDSMYFNKNNDHDRRDAHVLATAELKLEKSTFVVLCKDENLAQAFEKSGFDVQRDFKNFIKEAVGNEVNIPKIEIPVKLHELCDYQISETLSKSLKIFMNDADVFFKEYLKTLPIITDKLNAKLANMNILDAEIRKRILGYSQWFSPVGKKDLYSLLERRHYTIEQIKSNAHRLKQEKLLIETDNYWFTNKKDVEAKEICEQAMAVVMPEILEIMELN